MKSRKISLVPCPNRFTTLTVVTDTLKKNEIFNPEKDSNKSYYLTKPQKIQSLPGKRSEHGSAQCSLKFVLLL